MVDLWTTRKHTALRLVYFERAKKILSKYTFERDQKIRSKQGWAELIFRQFLFCEIPMFRAKISYYIRRQVCRVEAH